jgi:hypothetical protein
LPRIIQSMNLATAMPVQCKGFFVSFSILFVREVPKISIIIVAVERHSDAPWSRHTGQTCRRSGRMTVKPHLVPATLI